MWFESDSISSKAEKLKTKTIKERLSEKEKKRGKIKGKLRSCDSHSWLVCFSASFPIQMLNQQRRCAKRNWKLLFQSLHISFGGASCARPPTGGTLCVCARVCWFFISEICIDLYKLWHWEKELERRTGCRVVGGWRVIYTYSRYIRELLSDLGLKAERRSL